MEKFNSSDLKNYSKEELINIILDLQYESNETEKICPIMAQGFLDVKCRKNCAWWDKEGYDECAILSKFLLALNQDKR